MLSVVIIAKNEENRIAGAIESVKPFASQIVVVDTGSTDKTPIVATRCGAEVFFRLWTGDFSEARNYALSLAREPWILSIDADEVLDGESFEQNIQLFSEDVYGIRVKILNKLKDNTVAGHNYTRIFRNHPQIRFTGKVHEQINYSIAALGKQIADSDIIINHYGYAEQSPEKIDRNKELLLQELKNNPDDIWLKFHLAETYFAEQDFENAEILFAEVLSRNAIDRGNYEKSRIHLAQCLLVKEDTERIEKVLDFSSYDKDREGLRLFVLAANKMLKREFDAAIAIYNMPQLMNSSLVPQDELRKIQTEINKVFNLS